MRTETHTRIPTGTCAQRHRPAHPQVHMHSSADEHAHKHMCIETQDSTPAGTCAQQYICLSSSPVLAFIAPINTRTKSNLGGNEFVWIPFPGHHPSLKEVRAGNQGRNLEQKAQRECGFTGSLWLMLTLLSYTASIQLARDGATHSELKPPIPSIKTVFYSMATGQSNLVKPSTELHSSQMTLSSIKMTIKNHLAPPLPVEELG